MVKVKICGNRSERDVEITGEADAQGFIVGAENSPRNLDLPTAKQLIRKVPVFNTAVLVTPIREPERLTRLCREAAPDALQVHSDVNRVEAEQIRDAIPEQVRLYAVLTVDGDAAELVRRARALAKSGIDALLLDSTVAGQGGGTGTTHDWNLSRELCRAVDPTPVILAGGLTAANVGAAIGTVKPYAVDVSTGVETDGAKCPEKVRELLREAASAGG